MNDKTYTEQKPNYSNNEQKAKGELYALLRELGSFNPFPHNLSNLADHQKEMLFFGVLVTVKERVNSALRAING